MAISPMCRGTSAGQENIIAWGDQPGVGLPVRAFSGDRLHRDGRILRHGTANDKKYKR